MSDDFGALTYAALGEAGEHVTLRRLGTPNTDVTTWAAIRRYQPNELVNGIVQGDQNVIISNIEIAAASWPGPPRKGDFIIRQGNTVLAVEGVETVRVGTTIVRHNLQVRG